MEKDETRADISEKNYKEFPLRAGWEWHKCPLNPVLPEGSSQAGERRVIKYKECGDDPKDYVKLICGHYKWSRTGKWEIDK